MAKSGAPRFRRDVCLVILISAAIHIPFLNQAFHMDDAIYLLLARQVLKNPWFPQDVSINFEGIYAKDLASMEHPPLTAFILSLAGLGGGQFSEPRAHLIFLIFPVIAGISMFSLSRRFTAHPMISTSLLLALPVVYVMSHNLMTDLPLLALWTPATSLFICGVDAGNRVRIVAGAFVVVFASLISYAGLCLVPLLMAYALLRRDRYAACAACAIPLCGMLLWLAANYAHFGRLIASRTLSYYFGTARVLSPSLLLEKVTYLAPALGGTTIFPFLLLMLKRPRSRSNLFWALFLALALLFLPDVRGYALQHKVLFAILFVAGFMLISQVAFLLACSFRSLRQGDRIAADDFFLTAWFVGVFSFCIIFYMTGSARYLIPLTPPLVLLIVREAEARLDPARFKRFAAYALCLSSALALPLAVADYQFAGIYREFASHLRTRYSGLAGRIWFAGEWGLRAYLERLGGEQLGRCDSRPKRGDLLVVPTLATPYQTLFSDPLALHSLILVAPSEVRFEVPPLKENSALLLTLGLPFWEQSDGMEFSVRFVSGGRNHTLYSHLLLPQKERKWQRVEVPLGDFSGEDGIIVFSASTGESGQSDADWIALARARICEGTTEKGSVQYDFRGRFSQAKIRNDPGVNYHTAGNLPAFYLDVWLEQDPAVELLERHQYSPLFPVRLLDSRVRAGFWSSGWGMLPFSFAPRDLPLEEISIYRVIHEVDGYGETQPTWYPD